MEKFDPKEYRDGLAHLAKITPDKQERREILESNASTSIYERARDIHLEDIQTFDQKDILPIKEIAQRVKESAYLQKQFFGKTYTEDIEETPSRVGRVSIGKWTQIQLERSVAAGVANALKRSKKFEEAASLYEREASLDIEYWNRAATIREGLGDYAMAISDYSNYHSGLREKKLESGFTYDEFEEVFKVARCMEKSGDIEGSKLFLEKRANELENLPELSNYDDVELAQLWILVGREDKAKKVLEPLYRGNIYGYPQGKQDTIEEKLNNMYIELRRKGYEQNPETKEWQIKVNK